MFVPRLKDYFSALKYYQTKKEGPDRLHVPSLLEIHEKTGISYSALSRISNGKTKRLDLNTALVVIEYMRSLGHEMSLNDFFEYKPLSQPSKKSAGIVA